ncbi:MAG: GatB/YqeY domain-containing protein [Anaerovoracaceae bacterium]
MGLKEQLTADFKEAMKSKDKVAKDTVNLVRAGIKQYEVDKREDIDEEGILNIIAKNVKMRKDALPDFIQAGREDLKDAYEAEIKVLEGYLPEQLSEENIKEVIKGIADDQGLERHNENMGKFMGATMAKVKGKADGNTVRKLVQEFLK